MFATTRALVPKARHPFTVFSYSTTPSTMSSKTDTHTWYHDATIQVDNPVLTNEVINHPRIRCGSLLKCKTTVPSPTALYQNKVDSVEVALECTEQTTFYHRETYTSGHGKNRRTQTRNVTYGGQNKIIPTKTVVWAAEEEEEKEEEEEEEEDVDKHKGEDENDTTPQQYTQLRNLQLLNPATATTIDVALNIPLGLGPSFNMDTTAASNATSWYDNEGSAGSSSAHTLVLAAMLQPTEMTTFDRFIRFDWGYCLGIGANKNVTKYHPAERIRLASEPLHMLPSLKKRSMMLEHSSSRTKQQKKTFSVAKEMMNSIGSALTSIIGFALPDLSDIITSVGKAKDTGKENEKENEKEKEKVKKRGTKGGNAMVTENECLTTFTIDTDCLDWSDGAGQGSLLGEFSFQNGSTDHPCVGVDFTIERATTLLGSRMTYGANKHDTREKNKSHVMHEEKIYATPSARSVKLLSATQNLDVELNNKTTVIQDFAVKLPPLTPSFESELINVSYQAVCTFRYTGGMLITPSPTILKIPLCIVSRVVPPKKKKETRKKKVNQKVLDDTHELLLESQEDLEPEHKSEHKSEQESEQKSERNHAMQDKGGETSQREQLVMEQQQQLQHIVMEEHIDVSQVQDEVSASSSEIQQQKEIQEEEEEEQEQKLTLAEEYADAVMYVSHCRDTLTPSESAETTRAALLNRLSALRLLITVDSSWRSYERVKASRRRAARNKLKSNHRSSSTKRRHRHRSGASKLEEIEAIVETFSDKVIDEWKRFGDMKMVDAQHLYIESAHELAEESDNT